MLSRAGRRLSIFLVLLLPLFVIVVRAGEVSNGRIVFTVDRNIFTMSPDGSGKTQLTTSGQAYSPQFSPDGRTIAYHENGSIYLMDADGGNIRLLTTASSYLDRKDISWHPTGRRIAFTCEGLGTICIINADGTNRFVFSTNPNDYAPNWSPNGYYIAFTRSVDAGLHDEIYVQDIFYNSDEIRVTNNSVPDLRPVWSPDGKKLAFTRRDACFVLPNNEVLCLASYVYTVNWDGSGQTMLAGGSAEEGSFAAAPEWSPDGMRIVFWGGDFTKSGPTELYSINGDGTGRANITNSSGLSELYPDWGAVPRPPELDKTFDVDGKVTTAFGSVSDEAAAVALQPDGKILVAGYTRTGESDSDFAVARYNPDGSLDGSFSDDGKVTTSFGPGDDRGRALALQNNGKIIVTGYMSNGLSRDFALVRYNSDGSLDTSFDNDGRVTTDFGCFCDEARGVVIQPDGKTVAGGPGAGADFDFALARYNADGSLDASFDSDGKVTTDFGFGNIDRVNAVALQPDGKIVAAGSSYVNAAVNDAFALARYNPNGSLDNTFDGDGRVITVMGFGTINRPAGDVVHSLAIQSDGKIVAAGDCTCEFAGLNERFGLTRYKLDGSLDASFGSAGKVYAQLDTNSEVGGIAIQPDGKLVVAGLASDGYADFAVLRLNPDGSADRRFGVAGAATTDFVGRWDRANALVIQPDGKVILAGHASTGSATLFGLVRYVVDSRHVGFDYDGDGKTDYSVFRPSTGAWYLQRSTAGFLGLQFGASGDRLTPADYDGDGKTDIAVYRPGDGRWYILNSATGTVSYPVFGVAEDVPAPGDYDGDGKADLTVFRPSQGTWYRQNSSNGTFFGFQFGATGDVPTVGDFDGDGKNDLGIWRPSNGDWYNIRSSNGSVFGERFGQSGDKIAPADYDGDGKTDIAIYRPSTGLWVVRNSATATYSYNVFGAPSDVPISGDYDGDGKADIGVWRPSDGTWYVQRSSNGSFLVYPWGQNGDRPTPSAYGN